MLSYDIYINNQYQTTVQADHMNNAIITYIENNPLRLSDKIDAILKEDLQ